MNANSYRVGKRPAFEFTLFLQEKSDVSAKSPRFLGKVPMTSRTTTTVVAFTHPFELTGCPVTLPAGLYPVIAEDELIQSLSFEAYRRTVTFLVKEDGARTQFFPIQQDDLDQALAKDRALSERIQDSVAELSPPEEEI
ncbi:hypothetical protein [Aliiroseovarius crassostreae]|uniref:hypothetical protein n=1 Tax=Aliiroseovarius crassostreae TaxID=154981 RepID=UPI00220F2B6F|nr:hypothetical protein [Aliiroseovarius crassostreae]UWQ09689.1 hypothetical protein K3X25_15840 [Aliiroseovarius crassostreae]